MPSASWHNLALVAYIALIAVTLLWEGWLAPAPHFPPGFWLTIKSLPLLLPLFGLLRGKIYTFGWAAMLVLVYLLEGLVLTVSKRQDGFALDSVLPYALLETLLALTFFISATVYIRRRRQEMRQEV